MKYIFKAEKIVFEDRPGYMFYQYSGEKCIASQFVRDDDFKIFLDVSGINLSDIIFI